MAMCCASTASAMSGPTSHEAKRNLQAGLRAYEADSAGIPLSGGPIFWPVGSIDRVRKPGILYDVDLMPDKGFLYLAELDRRGRLHTLFVDVNDDVWLK